MAAFGVVFVNNRGQRAWRSRVLIRSLLPIIPLLLQGMLYERILYDLILYSAVMTIVPTLFDWAHSDFVFIVYVLLYLCILVGLPMISILSGRFIVDRITGCRIVPA